MHTTRKSLAPLGLALLISVTLPSCQQSSPEGRPRVTPELLEQVAELPSLLHESSGIAVSRRQDGILWTHNDSGDENRLYAIDLTGEVLATFLVRDATNIDWEDIALGPCPRVPRECLYIADTGDNLRRRESVSIYIVPEPDVRRDRPSDSQETEPASKVDFRYEDGPHDVEAMAVGPSGDILLVSKGQRSPIKAYQLLRDDLFNSPLVARLKNDPGLRALQTSASWVTGAAFSPSGDRVVVRTYTELFFYEVVGGTLVQEREPCFFGAFEPVGEAVDFMDASTLVMTSEALRRRPGPITLVRCPTGPA